MPVALFRPLTSVPNEIPILGGDGPRNQRSHDQSEHVPHQYGDANACGADVASRGVHAAPASERISSSAQ